MEITPIHFLHHQIFSHSCSKTCFIISINNKITYDSRRWSNAIVSGSAVKTTPFFTQDGGILYYLNLEIVRIGDTNNKLKTKTHANNANDKYGNIIIDSGTTLTHFPSEFYQKIEDEFKKIVPSTPVKGEEDLRFCYKKEEGFEENVPTITFHFTGADWELIVFNNGGAVFGNLQQMNYLVGYDLNDKTLSFKKTACTKH